MPRASVQAADRPLPGARLAVLNEGRGVEPVLRGDHGVEGPAEQTAIIAMRSFGASSPLKDLTKHFGFTADAVYQAAKKQLGK